MINKIENIANELGFISKNNTNLWISVLHKGRISYEIYINHKEKKGEFSKIVNFEFVYICAYTSDYNDIYKSILEEFKHELRNKKITKLLSSI